MTKIFVTGLKVEAQIGVYAHEKGKGQPLVVDVELDVPISGATRLADTVNYESVGEAARAIAAEGHILLVEDFAERLARACPHRRANIMQGRNPCSLEFSFHR